MPVLVRKPTSKRIVIHSNTGKLVKVGGSQRARNVKRKGAASREFGALIEDYLGRLQDKWVPADPGEKGIDFFEYYEDSGGRVLRKAVEVKALSPKFVEGGRVPLRIKDGFLHNQRAEEIYFASLVGVWKADALKLRQFVARQVHGNEQLLAESCKPGKVFCRIQSFPFD